MTTDPWTAEILADIAAAYANHDDIAELARGAAAVLALHQPDAAEYGYCLECGDEGPVSYPCPTVRALNLIGDTP